MPKHAGFGGKPYDCGDHSFMRADEVLPNIAKRTGDKLIGTMSVLHYDLECKGEMLPGWSGWLGRRDYDCFFLDGKGQMWEVITQRKCGNIYMSSHIRTTLKKGRASAKKEGKLVAMDQFGRRTHTKAVNVRPFEKKTFIFNKNAHGFVIDAKQDKYGRTFFLLVISLPLDQKYHTKVMMMDNDRKVQTLDTFFSPFSGYIPRLYIGSDNNIYVFYGNGFVTYDHIATHCKKEYRVPFPTAQRSIVSDKTYLSQKSRAADTPHVVTHRQWLELLRYHPLIAEHAISKYQPITIEFNPLKNLFRTAARNLAPLIRTCQRAVAALQNICIQPTDQPVFEAFLGGDLAYDILWRLSGLDELTDGWDIDNGKWMSLVEFVLAGVRGMLLCSPDEIICDDNKVNSSYRVFTECVIRDWVGPSVARQYIPQRRQSGFLEEWMTSTNLVRWQNLVALRTLAEKEAEETRKRQRDD